MKSLFATLPMKQIIRKGNLVHDLFVSGFLWEN